eukprot:Trichotokara_eunicae@DN3201_c0_g1_i1.p1
MYRNQYDSDVTTWSPQGRIFQIEYAMEGVKQGTCCVGVKSDEFVVLCCLKRALSKLAEFNRKMHKVDTHVGMNTAGITADAKVASELLRMEALHHRFLYDTGISVERLADVLSEKAQMNTQLYGKRPFCVGVLLGGYDKTGAHLFETSPTGCYYAYKAVAIGNRSQPARTYLEKHFDTFEKSPLEDLMHHAVKAMKASVSEDLELSSDNLSVGVVGKDNPWRELPREEVTSILQKVSTPEDVVMAE